MIRIFRNTIQQPQLQEVREPVPHSWITATTPSEAEVRRLSELLSLNTDLIQDTLDAHELPRVESEPNAMVVILRAVEQTGSAYRTFPLTVIFHKRFFATITQQPTTLLDGFVQGRPQIFTTQHTNFFVQICHRIIDNYQRYISTINRRVQTERKNLRKISQADILLLIETEEILNEFVSSLTPTILTIKKLLTNQYLQLYEQDRELIEDLLVDGDQVLQLCMTNLRTIRNIRDGYSTVMTIRLNQIMKVLTYLTAFLTIPMVVSSIYGMNVALPFADSPEAFSIVTGLSVSLIAVTLIIFVLLRKRL